MANLLCCCGYKNRLVDSMARNMKLLKGITSKRAHIKSVAQSYQIEKTMCYSSFLLSNSYRNPRQIDTRKFLVFRLSTSSVRLLTSFSNNNEFCWKCGGKLRSDNSFDDSINPAEKFYCPHTECKALQPPSNEDYFKQFSLPLHYNVELSELTRRYKQIQQRLHPDKFIHACEVSSVHIIIIIIINVLHICLSHKKE